MATVVHVVRRRAKLLSLHLLRPLLHLHVHLILLLRHLVVGLAWLVLPSLHVDVATEPWLELHLAHLSRLLVRLDEASWLLLLASILLLDEIVMNGLSIARSSGSLRIILCAKIELVVLRVPGDRRLVQVLNVRR